MGATTYIFQRGQKKERKKAVKEDQREKRKTKMPKSEKKRRIKVATNKR